MKNFAISTLTSKSKDFAMVQYGDCILVMPSCIENVFQQKVCR